MRSTASLRFFRILIAAMGLMWASWSWAAVGTLTVLKSGDAGFATQSYSSSTIRTVDFTTNTLGNTNGVAQGSSSLSGGTWTTTSASPPASFAGTYATLASKAGTANSVATTAISFTNGASYVSFLWNITYADGSSDITFNLSDGTSRTISNCSTTTDASCLASYNAINSLFTLWITGSSSQMSTPSTLRINFQPPNGVKVNSITLQAATTKVCGLWSAYYFCMFSSQESRDIDVDAISYDDGVPDPVVNTGTIDHLEIYADSSKGVTCAPNTMRVRACANASCSQTYTGGVTGAIKLTKGATVNSVNYTIASGSAYSSDVSVNAAAAGTWVASATSSATVTGANTCAIGALSLSSNCNLTVNSSGLVVTLDPHYAGAAANMQVQVAVGGLCTPTLLGVGNLLVNATASFNTSVLPSLTDSLGGVRSLSNGVTVGNIPISLNLAGLGNTSFKYAAGGAAKMDVSVTGVSTGLLNSLLNLTGDVVTRVVPKKLRLVPSVNGTDLTAATAKVSAGLGFQLKVQGEDSNGGVVPLDPDLSILGNLALTKSVVKPTGASLKNNPSLTTSVASLINNVATMNVSWDEVGTISLASSGVTNFMGSGLNVAAGALGGYNLKFVPAKFNVTATPRCSDGATSYAYAGQPIDVTVQAMNAANTVTQNYDGSANLQADRVANAVSLAAVTLPNVNGLSNGSLSGAALTDTAFASGVGSTTITDTLAPAKKLSAPEKFGLNASDTDVTTNKSTPSVLVRSGRIKLSNAYGNEGSPLSIPVQVQYWDGKAWVPARDGACAIAANIPTGAVLKASFKSHKGANVLSSALPVSLKNLALANGAGSITLNPPGKGFTGTVDVTLDLSSGGANMAWLQSRDDSCGANTVCNPKARASFGVYSSEAQKTVNIRNVY